MRKNSDISRIAVLIDADNASKSKLKLVMDEISAYGHVITKRAYGNWASNELKCWSNLLNELAIQPVQQFAHAPGKNATDIRMIIDTMDLLYADKYDTFVLVSSDSDFTQLAMRLREAEKTVIGIGEEKTPIAFRNACDTFILTETLHIEEVEVGNAAESDTQLTASDEAAKEVTLMPPGVVSFNAKIRQEVKSLLSRAAAHYQEDNGWTHLTSGHAYIKRVRPDFDPLIYGAKNLPELLRRMNKEIVLEKRTVKGDSLNWFYRVLDKAA